MRARVATGIFASLLVVGVGASASRAFAQPADDRTIVLVVDPGETRINVNALGTAIGRTLDRPLVRMTDERAVDAAGRLTIAYQPPNRWVLRYEARGQVAWVSDRILRPGTLRTRLAELSQALVARVDGSGAPPPNATTAPPPVDWDNDVVLALQNEIVDPFANEPPTRAQPVSVLWSEVVDPFGGMPARTSPIEVWSEVLDPWSTEFRR